MSAFVDQLITRQTPATSRNRSNIRGSVCLAELAQIQQVRPYLRCPNHPTAPVVSTVAPHGQTFRLRMTCAHECKHDVIGSSQGNSEGGPSSLVAKQLIFGCMSGNMSYGEYVLFCHALAVPSYSETYYKAYRSTSLRVFTSLWDAELIKYQKLAQKIGDRDVAVDATFDHKRDAENAIVTALSCFNAFIVGMACGSRQELQAKSTELEVLLSEQLLDEIIQSPLTLRSITHDEHQGVIKAFERKRHLLPSGFKRNHDPWHKFKRLQKEFTERAQKAKISVTAIEECNLRLMAYVLSALQQYRGKPRDFAAVVLELPNKFVDYGDTVVSVLRSFLAEFLPPDTIGKFCADTDTSALEGFHAHHHQYIPKFRFYHLYRERTAFHNLLWNSRRLEVFLAKEENEQWLPMVSELDILREHEFLRRAQLELGLAVSTPIRRRYKATAPHDSDNDDSASEDSEGDVDFSGLTSDVPTLPNFFTPPHIVGRRSNR